MHLLKWSAYYLSLLIVSSLLTYDIINKEYGLNSFLLWLLLILLLLFPPLVRYFQTRKKQKKIVFRLKPFLVRETELLLVAIICILPGLIALQTPEKLFFHGDEAIISRNAEGAVKASLETGKWNFLGHEDGTISRFPALWYVMQGFIINTLGPSVASVKTFSLLAHMGIVITQFTLISKFFNKHLAWAWVLFYSSMPLVIHFSITGYQNLQSTFFAVMSVALALFAVSSSSKAKQSLLLTTSGVIGGIGMYFYLSSLLIPAYLLIVLLISGLLSRTKIKQFFKNLLVLFFPFLLVSLPFWIVTINDYNFIAGRSGAFSPFMSEIKLAPFQEILIEQASKTFLPYVKGSFSGDGLFYVNLPALIHPLLAVISLVGLLVPFIFRKKFTINQKIVYVCMAMIVTTTIFFGSIITINPPAVQRVLTVFPYLTFFIILGVWFATFPIKRIFSMTFQSAVLFTLVILITVFQLKYYYSVNMIINFDSGKTHPYLFSLIDEMDERIMQTNDKILLYTQIPIHFNDVLYYYSNGAINPIVIKSQNELCSLLDYNSISKYIFKENSNKDLSCTNSSLKEIWSVNDFHLLH